MSMTDTDMAVVFRQTTEKCKRKYAEGHLLSDFVGDAMKLYRRAITCDDDDKWAKAESIMAFVKRKLESDGE